MVQKHAAAKGEAYACFVRQDAQIPFMAMPDAVTALLGLARAERAALTRSVYNVTSFSLTAAQIQSEVLKAFPDAQISFQPDVKRQAIVDSWPADLNDHDARRDWGWQPDYDMERCFQRIPDPEYS
jgi:threonine 3-dehydrogenase